MSLDPVHTLSFSPLRIPRENRLGSRLQGVVPVLHTPYDYDKGF
jgi:hypothetical protein